MPSQISQIKEPDEDALDDHELQYGHGPTTEEELEEKYPGRPRNHSKTLPFHELFTTLFDPLNENKAKPSGPHAARKKGPGSKSLSPHEMRRSIIERFVSRWRSQVGDDFYPAVRLILPEKDRDRAMYGLKEKAIGKLIIRMLKINNKSEDALSLINWKDIRGSSKSAGDFAGRCYDVLVKRAMRTKVGDMRIAEVNSLLDKLSAVSKEEDQLPIFNTFYNRMNADELMWLIRIILRQMKVGASEKTILDIWHPDGEALFNVSSSLRRVCWELVNPDIRIDEETRGITLMECFKPQLAQFQSHSFQKMIEKMGLDETEKEHVGEFWIEEKLDGERMQMHMKEDDNGNREYRWLSRNGKDYSYLYGTSTGDEDSALTRHFADAFDEGVESIILDGEMITWDVATDVMVGFGTLKTAALAEGRNGFQLNAGIRPLFRVFDCLYLNGTQLTPYSLRQRRDALEASVRNVHRRIEKHHYTVAHTTAEIETHLRQVVAEASEGLVLKKPSSVYRLNDRNNEWMKVKPEYMTEFGESLDCVVIGGYYGSGRRGGALSSFLCGLRVNQNHITSGANPMKCYSFCKVGGGFRAEDYAKIRHLTDGKWNDWDPKKPPKDLIVLGGGERQYERPDVWIEPCDSVVLEVKAASVGASDQFGTKFTLRFPRFRKIKDDKSWDQALSLEEFDELKEKVEAESKGKEFKVENRRMAKRLKKAIVIAGNDSKVKMPYAGPKTKIFEGLDFCVMTEMQHPVKKSKAEVEQAIKLNGGNIFQSVTARQGIICIGDKKVIKVASLIKKDEINILKPAWVYDALRQAEADGPDRPRFLLPFEPNHLFHMLDTSQEYFNNNVDVYGDSYARDTSVAELKMLVDDMIHPKNSTFSADDFLTQLEEHGRGLGERPGSMCRGCVVRFVSSGQGYMDKNIDLLIAKNRFLFSGGRIAESDKDEEITHFVMVDVDRALVKGVRQRISSLTEVPRIVGMKWLEDSWVEKTLMDEERYAV
ncbi:related to DNA ligase 4 [Rhynchosporium agropyri]|uniref:DNA ligase n=1 Tax=Rhynchosporium agropyri TaxID=914238 RepID=A0A1E1KG25_9HELO|nr:related to DNA ligase 4 [Rhynchosporium agropyri]